MKNLFVGAVLLIVFVLVSGMSTLCLAGTNSGLVVHFPFGGNAKDQSGHRRDGKVHGAVPAQDRHHIDGGAYGFDGKDDWLEISDLDCELNYDKDWSISFWAYVDSTGRYDIIFAGADGDAGAKQFVVSTRYVKMSHKADSDYDWRVNFSEAARDSWHMYSVIWHKYGHLKVYIDGELQGEDLVGELGDFCPSNTPVIGAVAFYGKTQFFKGRVADFRIYDRVLGGSDIQQLYKIVP